MMVAFHSAPDGFFKSNPPYANAELLRLIQKARFLGFKCLQVGPLTDFADIDGKRLASVLDHYNMERNVHVGGLYDAEKLATTEEECERAQKQIHRGIELCREISSALVSFHPPFFTTKDPEEKPLLPEAKARFLKLVEKEVEFACNHGIRMALESFCYHPFIFNGLSEFMEFVSHFPSPELGVLFELGHLHQAGFELDEAIQAFRDRLLEVHVHDARSGGDFREATHLPVGKGSIDFPRVISVLHEIRYEGWLTLEIRGDEREIVESREYLESLINMTT